MTAMDIPDHARTTIARRRMLAGGETVVAGVSGGPDSTALAHVLAECRRELDLVLHIAHFNHHLRPDAAEDAAAVAHLARSLGCPYHEGGDDVRASARREHRSPEDAARRLRYAFLISTARTVGADVAATGHTLDDQAETVLLRLIRGSGPHGLIGILPVRVIGGIRVIRPLIDVVHADIEAYLRERGIPWRDDPTNQDLAILRNRVRRVLLPILAGYNHDVRHALARLADLVRDEEEAAGELFKRQLNSVLSHDGRITRIWVTEFSGLPAALQRRALREAVRHVRGNVETVAFVHLDGARRMILDGRSGATAELPGGVRVRRLRKTVEVSIEPQETPPENSTSEYVLPVPGSVVAAEFAIQVVASVLDRSAPGVGDAAPEAGSPASDVGGPVEGPLAQGLVIDAGLARHGLLIRSPRPGDRFEPSGMGGRTKKVMDYLSDAGVPRHRRRYVPVLVTKTGQILWIIGMRAAHGVHPVAEGRHVRVVARRLRA
jgi:tRNA(Ile)-lysidine synthase